MKYTDSLYERETQRTTPKADDVYELLIPLWPELTEEGALTFTAQFWHETGGGRNCYNWNLGNVKGFANQKHMYLRNVWEVYPNAEAMMKAGGVHAGENFLRTKGLPLTTPVVVFQPPHPQCRFAAYDSLAEGAARWLGHHQKISRNHPGFLEAANAGDLERFNHLLKEASYYTATEAGYLKALLAARRAINPPK